MATFGDIKISTINGGPLSGMRNAVINGNFSHNQRGVSGTVTLAAGAYGHDRFKAGAGGCTYTFATSQNVTTLTITAGTLIQVIEGANLLTDTYTLTFTGTAQGKIGAGSFGASGITGSVTGGTNLNVEFNTGTVSLVQLERGSVATPFEFRSIGQELELCQRYFVGNFEYAFTSGFDTAYESQNNGGVAWSYQMRATPSVVVTGGEMTGHHSIPPSAITVARNGARFRFTGSAVRTNANTSATVSFFLNAEL